MPPNINQRRETENGNMFALPTPYIAERQTYTKTATGMRPSWERCKVIGITKDDEGELHYIVEAYHGGTSSLSMEFDVRRIEPGNPL